MFELMTPTSGDIDHGDIASHALTRVLARALDEVDYGIVLARADATIVHANHHARRALEGEHPLQLLGQRLRTRETQDLGRLHDALLAAAERQRRCLLTLGRGTQPLAVVCRKIGVSEQTYYRWRKEYGGLKLDQAKRFKDLERENARLKKLVADQALDIAILKEAADPNL
jgi:hypothetical protein